MVRSGAAAWCCHCLAGQACNQPAASPTDSPSQAPTHPATYQPHQPTHKAVHAPELDTRVSKPPGCSSRKGVTS